MFDAIYTRQSVDKPDSISIETQVDFCKKEVADNYPIKVYNDKGYSGKNIERPGFQELLRDIQRKMVRRVIVYRLDRISRSVIDFANVIEIFQKNNVSFVSTMEKFDTDTPIGKAMLMIVMVFAQLERETIQCRIFDAYRSRSRKGFYMGGRIPYGFKLKEITIDGAKTKSYDPIPEQIRMVQEMFNMYQEPQTSLGDIVRFLSANDVKRPNGADFTRARVRDILINPIYVRADKRIYDFYTQQRTNVTNPPEDFIGVNGAYLYSSVEQKTSKASDLSGKFLVLAPHEGCVDSVTWLRSRAKLLNNVAVAKPLKAKATWLAGKIKCGYCGYSLIARTWHCKTKQDNRYFLCSHKYESDNCTFSSLNADQIEAYVLSEMKKKMAEFEVLRREEDRDIELKTIKLKEEILGIDIEVNGLMEKLASANAVLTQYISDRISQLDSRKQEIQAELSAQLFDDENREAPNAIQNHLQTWDELSFSDKLTVVDSLIVKVVASKEKIQIFWKI